MAILSLITIFSAEEVNHQSAKNTKNTKKHTRKTGREAHKAQETVLYWDVQTPRRKWKHTEIRGFWIADVTLSREFDK